MFTQRRGLNTESLRRLIPQFYFSTHATLVIQDPDYLIRPQPVYAAAHFFAKD
jgi:hypothetical protein